VSASGLSGRGNDHRVDERTHRVHHRAMDFLNPRVDFSATLRWMSASRPITPPSRPVIAIVVMPFFLAAVRARWTLAELPLVEIPNAMSPFAPSASTWRVKTTS